MNKMVMDKNITTEYGTLIKTDKSITLGINRNSEINLDDYDALELICNIDSKVDVFISDINSNIKKYIFNCGENSNIEINKFNSNNESYKIDVNLSKSSSVKLVISTVASDDNIADINIHHIGSMSYSKCINNGVVNNGSIVYNVNGIIEKCSINSTVLQNSKIITKDVKLATIKPVLIINETVEEANHSASIGYYDKDILFYLESRGIKYEDAVNLLNKGLLTSNFKYKEKIESLI